MSSKMPTLCKVCQLPSDRITPVEEIPRLTAGEFTSILKVLFPRRKLTIDDIVAHIRHRQDEAAAPWAAKVEEVLKRQAKSHR